MGNQPKSEYPAELALNKKLVTSEPGAVIGDNFKSLVNMRYKDNHLQAVRGMTKVNSSALSGVIKAGHHFKKDRYDESHVLVQLENSAGDAAYIYDNESTIPGTGNFGSSIYTEDSNYQRARFSDAPDGNVICCDGKETLIWGGHEIQVGGFINYDPGGSFSYDYTDQVRNTNTDASNVAVISVSDGGVDSNTRLLLHMNETEVDSSGQSHVPVDGGVVWDTGNKVFGTASAKFESGDYISVPDSTDWYSSAGTWSVDCRVYQTALANGTIFYQGTDADNYHKLSTTDSGAVSYVVQESGSPVVEVDAPAGTLTAGNWVHVELTESGNDYYIFADGTQKGYAADAQRPADYTGSLFLGADDTAGTNYLAGNIDEFRFSSTARHTAGFEPQGAAYSSTSASPWFYLGSTRPLEGFKFYMDTANTQAGTMAVEYWDGSSFSSVSNISDGTSDSGVSLAKTGSVSFDSTVGLAKVKSIDGVLLYWYRVHVTAADNATSIYHISVNAPMQPVVDIWDGLLRNVLAFQWYTTSWNEYTSNVYDNEYDSGDDGTRVDVGGLTTSQYFVCGFDERMSGVSFSIVGGTGNTTANTNMTVEYWNGSDWTSVGAVDDATSEDGISMAQSGTVTWNPPTSANEFRKEINKDVQLYYYKFSFDKNLSADVKVYYVAGIPAQGDIGGYSVPLLAHNVVWLLDEVAGRRNSARCSAEASADVWNGDSVTEFEFGNDTKLVGGCALFTQFGSSLYNMTIFLKENEVWAVVGNSPEDWTKYRVSESVGCTAPGTIVSASIGYSVGESLNRHIAIWQATDGIYLFDGRAPSKISDDIANYFDPNESEHINSSLASDSVAFFDHKRLEYHWLFASGADATDLNTEMVFDLKRGEWFEIDRTSGKDLQCGFPVSDFNSGTHAYGCNGGTMYRLENGSQFDDQDISCVVWTGDMAPHKGSILTTTSIRTVKLVALAKTEDYNVTVTHYGDVADTGTILDAPLSLSNSGFGVAQPPRSLGSDSSIFHSFKFEITSNADEIAFEPLYIGIIYKTIRADR